jgi:hypothetical protein
MVITLVLVMVLGFIGMLASTFDILLSVLVVVATFGVQCGLMFFITVIMRWPIGPVEVIALIVFIGYAVTYSLHISYKYASIEALRERHLFPLDMDSQSAMRWQRTQFALKSIGGATIGSAITTVGCSVFLLFCTLTIFVKLGAVILLVTLISLVTALVPLPASLLIFGPREPGSMCHSWCDAVCQPMSFHFPGAGTMHTRPSEDRQESPDNRARSDTEEMANIHLVFDDSPSHLDESREVTEVGNPHG